MDGTALLYVHGRRLLVETRDGGPVEQQRNHLSAALPRTSQDVRLHLLEGRGYVHIVEQPRADNDFTLAIAIEDPQQGSSFYSISVDWDSGDAFDRAATRGRNQVKWSGRVEGHAIVSCGNDRCSSEAVSGAPVMHERYKFTRPLPRRDVRLKLERIDGRGEIRLLEQPAETNGYTARVDVSDPEGGAGDYVFTLAWGRDEGRNAAPTPAQTGFTWLGRVSGTVRVTLRGGASYSQVVSGGPVSAEQAKFDRPLPARSDLQPLVRKQQGTGKVEIVEYPNARNGYNLVFEIRNTAPAADMYEVEVAW